MNFTVKILHFDIPFEKSIFSHVDILILAVCLDPMFRYIADSRVDICQPNQLNIRIDFVKNVIICT